MGHNITSSDLSKHRDQLEERVSAVAKRIGAAATSSPYHREQLEDLRARAHTLRQKLQATDESAWDEATHVLKADWESLLQGFDRWAKRVDEEFRHRP
jgi:hypothetical protein